MSAGVVTRTAGYHRHLWALRVALQPRLHDRELQAQLVRDDAARLMLARQQAGKAKKAAQHQAWLQRCLLAGDAQAVHRAVLAGAAGRQAEVAQRELQHREAERALYANNAKMWRQQKSSGSSSISGCYCKCQRRSSSGGMWRDDIRRDCGSGSSSSSSAAGEEAGAGARAVARCMHPGLHRRGGGLREGAPRGHLAAPLV
jgi:hypothetical protein